MKLKNHYSVTVILSLIMFLLLAGNTSVNSRGDSAESAKVSQQRKLRHVVLFKFKEGTTQSDIRKVEEAFKALPGKIPQIRGFEWGTNNSPEGLDKGFTHCFFLTFDSEADRAVYLPHPEHKAFGSLLGPYLDDVLVVDYWTKN